jgi:hypothetical protein
MDGLTAEILHDTLMRGARTGIRAAVLLLTRAGHISGNAALAYGVVLGAEEVDPLVVLGLGAQGDNTGFLTAAQDSLFTPEGEAAAEALVAELNATVARLEEEYGVGDAGRADNSGGGDEAGGQDAGAVPADDAA